MPSGATGMVGGGIGAWRDRGHLEGTEAAMALLQDPGMGGVRDTSGRSLLDLHAPKPGGGTQTRYQPD